MGTRAAAFSAKIKSLAAAQGVVTAGTVPAPTGADLAASYRWFSATLLSILKASASCSLDVCKEMSFKHNSF